MMIRNFLKLLNVLLHKEEKTLLNSLVNTNILNNKEQGIKILKELGLKEKCKTRRIKFERFCSNFR